jgi:ketosteroid isomerase-like protein
VGFPPITTSHPPQRCVAWHLPASRAGCMLGRASRISNQKMRAPGFFVESSMLNRRSRRACVAAMLGLLSLDRALADPPAPAGSGAAASTPGTHGGFFSSLKQAFSEDVGREVVWAHFDVGAAPDTHRFYCLLDPKTGKHEPNGVAGQPFVRPDGMTGLKNPAISPVSCADAEQKGILSTDGYTVKMSSGGKAAPVAGPGAAQGAAAATQGTAAASHAPAAAAAGAAAATAVATAPGALSAAPAGATHPQGSDLRAQMEAANAAFLAAYNGRNGAAFKALYTSDAMLLAPGSQPVVGAEAIAAFWADRIKGGSRKNHTLELVEVWSDGRYAYQVARYGVDVLNDKGEIFKSAGNTVRIFERQPDGQWLTKVHIFNAY